MHTLITTGFLMMGLTTLGAGCATTDEASRRRMVAHFASL
jgi:hypothetical protein